MAMHGNIINVHQLVIGHLGAITNGQTGGEHIHLGIIAHLGAINVHGGVMNATAEPNQIPASVGAQIMDGVETLPAIKNMEPIALDVLRS